MTTSPPLFATRQEAQGAVALAIQSSPAFFLEEILGSSTHYDKQLEILDAILNETRVAVVGCNSSGKDWTTGRAVLWWLHAYAPAKVFVYGPTHRQVDDIVFNETRDAFNQAAVVDGFKLQGKVYKTSRYEIGPQQFALGFATDDDFNILGFHSPNLLVIVTEAHAIGQAEMDALWRLGPKCMLMTGNPFVDSGPFYDAHTDQAHNWHTIQIGAWDTPNFRPDEYEPVPGMMTPDEAAHLAEIWGEDSPKYQGAVLGLFPDNLEDALVPRSWVAAAVNRMPPREAGPDVRTVLACDVAREGADETTLFFRRGNYARLLYAGHIRDLMQVVSLLAKHCTIRQVDDLVIDDTGLGGGVTDRLKELRGQLSRERTQLVQAEGEEVAYDLLGLHSLANVRIHAFKGGAKAADTRDFINRNAEIWWRARLWCARDDTHLTPDPTLQAQLSSRKYTYESDQRIKLERKVDMAKRGLDSPDRADGFCMTFAPDRARLRIWT